MEFLVLYGILCKKSLFKDIQSHFPKVDAAAAAAAKLLVVSDSVRP